MDGHMSEADRRVRKGLLLLSLDEGHGLEKSLELMNRAYDVLVAARGAGAGHSASAPVAAPVADPLPEKGNARFAAAPRRKLAWTRNELERAAALLDSGMRLGEVAEHLGRTPAGLGRALHKGLIPVRVYKRSPARVYNGVLQSLARGRVPLQSSIDIANKYANDMEAARKRALATGGAA